MCIYLLHGEQQQLHVSALLNGHLQVVYENSFVGSYTKHICELLIWGWEGVKWVRDLVSGLRIGWSGLHGGFMLLQSYI